MMHRLLLLLASCAFASWQSEQIHDDLAAFEKLRRCDLDQALEMVGHKAAAAHIVIKGGAVFAKRQLLGEDIGADYRLKDVLKALSRWQKSAKSRPSRKLPDTEFILALGDGLDTELCGSPCDLTHLPLPVFVFCKKSATRHLALLPDPGALLGRAKTARAVWMGDLIHPWKKKKEILFWRGSGSDGGYTAVNWSSFPRSQLVLHSLRRPDLVDASFTALPHMSSKAAFERVICKVGALRSFVSPKGHIAYKYLMDIDGISNGWDRCFWGLLSSSVLFKQKSPYQQWFYKALEENRHYIGLERNLEDLEEKILWARKNDAKMMQIAKEGSALAKVIFRRSAIFGYVRDLLIEYTSRFED